MGVCRPDGEEGVVIINSFIQNHAWNAANKHYLLPGYRSKASKARQPSSGVKCEEGPCTCSPMVKLGANNSPV